MVQSCLKAAVLITAVKFWPRSIKNKNIVITIVRGLVCSARVTRRQGIKWEKMWHFKSLCQHSSLLFKDWQHNVLTWINKTDV